MATNEERPIPARAIHPGEVLREELRERGIKQKELATLIGVQPSHLSEVINGKRPINVALAHKLQQQLGTPYTVWMNLQNSYDYDKIAIAHRDLEAQPVPALQQAPSAPVILLAHQRAHKDTVGA